MVLHFTLKGQKFELIGIDAHLGAKLCSNGKTFYYSWPLLVRVLHAHGVPVLDRWNEPIPTCTTYLRREDFRHGTVRITNPGFYILVEDVDFKPYPRNPEEGNPEYDSPAYSLGFFAAITIECERVVLDLAGHTLKQSLPHYAHMRFFNTIELASAAFIRSQGPGSINTDDSLEAVARHCVIQNGTIGLTSHAHVHGNKNSHVELRHLKLLDFEVAAVQLNGVDRAHLQHLHMRALRTVPLDCRVFSLTVHLDRLRREARERPELRELVHSLEGVQRALLQPFHEVERLCLDTDQSLERVYHELRGLGGEARFFVNRHGKPDSSALYGIVIWCTGVAIGKMREACVQRMDGSTRRSSHVHIEDVTIEDLHLHARESVARLNKEGQIMADVTGAIVEWNTERIPRTWTKARQVLLLLESDKDVSEAINALADSLPRRHRTRRNWSVVPRRTEGGACPRCPVLHGGAADPKLPRARKGHDAKSKIEAKCNLDLMAHVAKGVLAVRVGHSDHVTLTNITIRRLRSTGERACIPPTLRCVAANEKSESYTPLDNRSPSNFGGSDTRGIFIGDCTDTLLTSIIVDDLVSDHSVVRGVEFDHTSTSLGNTTLRTARVCNLKGICRNAVYVQPQCPGLTIEGLECDVEENVNSTERFLKELTELLGDVPVSKQTLRNVVSRFVTDPSLLVVEAQGARKVQTLQISE